MWLMSPRRIAQIAFVSTLTLLPALFAPAQDSTRRGRKYKAPPETSHIEVVVTRENNGKPLLNAAVVFHATKDGRDEGNLEVKTNEDGKAIIDVIAIGSTVGIQVIADGFATYAGDFQINEASREIAIKMIRPRAQISTYVDTQGKASDRPIGVQEPSRPQTAPVTQTPKPTNHTSDPGPLAPVSQPPVTNPTGVPPPQ